MSTTRLFCTMYLDELHFGVEVQHVQEVLRYLEMTRVPLAHPVVRGLINLRGQLVTALDLRRRLELPDRPADKQPANVIVRTEEGPISLLVDKIGDVVEVNESDFERSPETLIGVANQLLKGAYKLNGRLLLVLDIKQVISFYMEAAA